MLLAVPEAAKRSVLLLESAPSQEEQIECAKSSDCSTGWTEDLQKRYFAWFVKAAAYRGASFRKFVDAIKNDALSMLNDGQKVAMKDILEAEPSIQSPLEAIAARSFVKEWSASELQRALSTSLKRKDFDKGRKVFGEAACFSCHRFDGGEERSARFDQCCWKVQLLDLLESILEPSKVVSDQYAPSVFTMENRDTVTGRVINLGSDNITVNVNMFDPNGNVGVDRKKVVRIEPSKISMMPEGLYNMLEKDEIMDLLACPVTWGRNHPMFQ